MSSHLPSPWVAASLCAATLASLQGLAAQPAHPASPEATVQQYIYESAFTGYRSYQEPAATPWREANDEAARIGGQAGIFGGAGHSGHAATKPATDSPPAPSKPQSMHGKGHQGMMK